MTRMLLAVAVVLSVSCAPSAPPAPRIRYQVRQITSGPQHHYFGYIGHVRNTPFNGDDSRLVALRVGFQDRMPESGDAADIVLLDPANGYAAEKMEETRAWNPQQGTMLYWNPAAPERQFFFNDRDPETNRVFSVLYDVVERRRIREYRYDDVSFGNGGVAQKGGYFLGLNYGRMARLRPVTGYPGAFDWTVGQNHPADDGVFIVDVETGENRLLVSFQQMRDALVERHPEIDDAPLFINHSLSNRDNDRVFFFVRGNFSNSEKRINVPMTVHPDGSGLVEQSVFIGGHPEWEFGPRMIGAVGDDMVLYNTEAQQIVQKIGTPEIFPEPEGDTALSSDGDWIVTGATEDSQTVYTIYRRSDGAWVHTEPFQRGEYQHGDLRIDPAPCWNRAGNAFVFPALAPDGTRQMFLASVEVE